MTSPKSFRWLLIAMLLGGAGIAGAQPKVDLGQREYLNKCAACHGEAAKGNGPYNELLKKSASDLTTLAKRNGGVFPVARVYEVIEGGGVGHGSRDMPVFGTDYKLKAGEYYGELPYNPEVYVRGRILSLVEYLNRVQVK